MFKIFKYRSTELTNINEITNEIRRRIMEMFFIIYAFFRMGAKLGLSH